MVSEYSSGQIYSAYSGQGNPETPDGPWVQAKALEDERNSSLALMKLLSDEKHKSEALAAELAAIKRTREPQTETSAQREADGR
jgi:hypothetical protein